MDLMQMKDGRRYRVTGTVVNQAQDRRQKHDASRVRWQSGDVWRASVRWTAPGTAMPLARPQVRLYPVRVHQAAASQCGSVSQNCRGFVDLLASLEELVERVEDVIAGRAPAVRVLERLVEKDLVTMEQVRAQAFAIAEEVEDDDRTLAQIAQWNGTVHDPEAKE